MHNTLKEIATYVRTIKLLTLSNNLEINLFFENKPSKN